MNHCPVCHATETFGEEQYLDYKVQTTDIFKNLTIRYCNKCGYGFSYPLLESSVIEHFYTNGYRAPGSPHYINFSALAAPSSEHVDCRSVAQLLLAKQFVDFESGDCFVDVGPGDGLSFHSARKILQNPHSCAVELANGASEAYKRIYGVHEYPSIGAVLEAGYKPRIVLSSHSLEHFDYEALKRILAMIRSAISGWGVLVAEVPHDDMRLFSQSRTKDYPHFSFFSADSLRLVLESAGFEILYLNSCGPRRLRVLPGSALHSKTITKNPARSRARHVLRGLLSKLPAIAQKSVYRIHKGLIGASQSKSANFLDDNFAYGENRALLRVVARA